MSQPTPKPSAVDIVMRALEKWQRDDLNTWTEPHVQKAIAALLIAQKAQQDPAAVMEANRAEDARKRAEDQWLDTFNANIAAGGDADTATQEAVLTHGQAFVRFADRPPNEPK